MDYGASNADKIRELREAACEEEEERWCLASMKDLA